MNDVDRYLAALPEDRREALQRVRDVINANLPPGYEEKIQYGMISWCVPESVLPAASVYNKQQLAFVSLATQKKYMSLYMMSVYGDNKERAWFEDAFKKAGLKLDMGKACVRFKSVDELPLDVVGQAVSHVPMDRYVDAYLRQRSRTKTAQAKAARKAAKPAKSAKPAKAAKAAKPAKSAKLAKAAKAAKSAKSAKSAAPKKRRTPKSR